MIAVEVYMWSRVRKDWGGGGIECHSSCFYLLNERLIR